jgi:hypothetical protein
MVRGFPSVAAIAIAVFLTAESATSAACINRFVARKDRLGQVVTLLTGKLTFQEAQELARNIDQKKAPPLEWVDDSGKTIAKQFGELKVIRPMPVGCDGRTSGVVMTTTFVALNSPSKKMNVKLGPDNVVAFEQQSE